MARRVIFADRADAGRMLAERLAELGLENPAVFALPRGGVPVGAVIAGLLGASLDIVFVRKLGAPLQPELAVGAVAGSNDAPEIVLHSELVAALKVTGEFVRQSVERELAVIERQRQLYAGARSPIAVQDRAAIVVDDGVATGMTMQAALRSIRRMQPARLVAAAPVAAREAASLLREEADEAVFLSTPRRFGSVGSFYRTFDQVTDAEVIALLEDAGPKPAGRDG